jgi:Tfp pilus assembly protein PilF
LSLAGGQKAGEPVKTFKGSNVKKLILLLAGIILINLSPAQADQVLVDLAKKVKPSVVLIETFDKNDKPIGQGSGFFVNNKGHIVTNHHVLEGAYHATVKTSSGMEYPVEGIIAKNIEADIVKLVVNIPDANITFLNLSENVPSEGEDIVVIGNPLGLESTVSAGIVSAVRDIPGFGKIFQITAPVLPGSIGSPVVNMKGEVIGIATLVVTKGQNLNFAIPSDKIIALKETSQTPIFNALAVDLNDAQLFYQKGLKELWQENWSAALTCFQKVIGKNPQDSNTWFQVGYCYDKLGRYQDAMESYKQAIRINPDYADAYYNLGIVYGNLGRYQDEMESYKQAIRIKPDLADVHYNLGIAYINLRRYQDAIESYKQAIRIKPDYAKAHYGLGVAYLIVSDKGSALEEYKILKTLDTELANKLFKLIHK